jgi:hypothetical protein
MRVHALMTAMTVVEVRAISLFDSPRPLVLNLLIARGANVALTDRHGLSPLATALLDVPYPNEQVVLCLIDAGVPLDDPSLLCRAASLSAAVVELLDAPLTCTLVQACGPVAHLVPFHHWWQLVTLVKHFNNTGSQHQI